MTAPDPVGGPPGDAELIRRALAARDRAYAPYSRYQVGCAVWAGDRIIEAANIENASHGLTICAERAAIARAIFERAGDLHAVAVATGSSPPATPCGMCLQTLNEFATDPAALRVILVNPQGERVDYTLAQLLPFGFHPRHLTGG